MRLHMNAFPIQERYLKLIRIGKKLVEGRVCKAPYSDIKKGDRIKFYASNDESVECLVKNVKNYSNFKEMLSNEGLQNCLPGVESLEEGVNIYHSFPGYEENSQKYGVLAIHVMPNLAKL